MPGVAAAASTLFPTGLGIPLPGLPGAARPLRLPVDAGHAAHRLPDDGNARLSGGLYTGRGPLVGHGTGCQLHLPGGGAVPAKTREIRAGD